MRDAPEEGFVTKTNMERITNGVFAFTMTLLARDIVLPAEWVIPQSDFLQALFIDIGPNILNFIGAFLVLAVLWFFIYQIYRNITAVDRPFAYLLMLFLMFLVFTPFASEIDQIYNNPEATAIFALTLAFLGIISVLLWLYAASSPHIINPDVSRKRVTFQAMKYSVIPVLAIVALILSLLGIQEGDIVYLFVPFILLIGFREKLWGL